MEITYELPEKIEAPVTAGDEIGKVVFWMNQKELGRVALIALEDAKRAGFSDYLKIIFLELLC